MKKLTIIIVAALLCLDFSLSAQVKALKIGDRVPEQFWNIPHTYYSNHKTSSSEKLSKQKDKLIILDFWATWCASCIVDMLPNQKLLESYGDKIKLIYVSDEPLAKIEMFSKSNRNPLKNNFVTIYNDTSLRQLFPHRLIPHLVWVLNNRVVAITQGDELNTANIDMALAGNINTLAKVDRPKDVPLFMAENPTGLRAANLLFHGEILGIGSGNEPRSSGLLNGVSFKNSSLSYIYSDALVNQFEWFSVKRYLIDSLLNEKFFNPEYKPEEMWTVDYWSPTENKKTQGFEIQQFLNWNSGYDVAIIDTVVRCLVCRYEPKNAITPMQTKGGQITNTAFQKSGRISNAPVQYLLNRLQDRNWVKWPVLDQSGITYPVDLVIPPSTSLAELNKSMIEYGLIFSFEKQQTKMIQVIKKTK